MSSTQLSSVLSAAANPALGGVSLPVVVLFHGAGSCEWSREFWSVWAEVVQQCSAVCLVAIDARRDSMLNYNMMVLGFPTVLRVRAERKTEVFRGNRSVEALLEWVVGVTGVAPVEGGWEETAVSGKRGRGVDLRDVEEGVDWVLVGANVVAAVNLIWILVRGCGRTRRTRRTRRDEDGDEEERDGERRDGEDRGR